MGKIEKSKYYYIYLSDDEYKLPEVVADTVGELSRMTGKSETNIRSSISKYEHGILPTSRFVRVSKDDV